MKRFNISGSKEYLAYQKALNHRASAILSTAILNTTKSLSIIPQIDLKHNLKQLDGWRDKKKLEKKR